MSPSAHEAVIFDLDGTLVDSEELYTLAAQSVLTRFGKVYDWELKRQVIGGDPLVGARLVVQQLQLPITPEAYLSEREALMFELCKTVAPMPGAAAWLELLRGRGVPLGIATSSRRELAELKLAAQSFGGYFAAVACSDDPGVTMAKPAPDVFLAAARKLGADPARCLVFEDTPKGVAGARAAGMTVIAVPHPRMPHSEFTHAHAIWSSLHEATLDALELSAL
jgi:pseudouridine 5'-phosphatase